MDGTSPPSPAEVAAQPGRLAKGAAVSWGGLVLAADPVAGSTQVILEVLSYPLDAFGQPDRRQRPDGRFLVDIPPDSGSGSVQPGRIITATGAFLGYQDAQIGERQRRYPAVRGSDVRAWSVGSAEGGPFEPDPAVRFGLGVGSGGAGWGVGIGF